MTRKTKVFSFLAIVAVLIVMIVACKPIPFYLQQVYKAYGKVVDDESGVPVESVEVFLHPYQYSVLTNGLGDYGIELSEGTWTLDFVKDGYTTESRTVTVNAANPRVNVNVGMVWPGAVSKAQATKAAQTVAGVVSLVDGWDEAWTENGSSLSFSTAGLSMSGTKTTSQYGDDVYALTIVLSNYVDSTTGYTANGTVYATLGGSATVAADVALVGGPVTMMTWDHVVVDTSGTGTATGVITCNGKSFDAGDISAAGTFGAYRVWQSMFDGIIKVFENLGSFTGTNISYSGPGLEMVGTHSFSGDAETYDMTVTYSNFAGNTNRVYTVSSGQIHFRWDIRSNGFTWTLASDLTLSGGPITTMKCSNVIAASPARQGRPMITEVTGNIAFSGVNFAAKTMPWND
jgi:hypothetical protein